MAVKVGVSVVFACLLPLVTFARQECADFPEGDIEADETSSVKAAVLLQIPTPLDASPARAAALQPDRGQQETALFLRDHSTENISKQGPVHLSQMVRGLAGDCGRPEVAAMLASGAAFDSGLFGSFFSAAEVTQVKQSLASAGFTEARRFEVSVGTCPHAVTFQEVADEDAAVLWKRGQDKHCLLAFRGSNCFGDGFSVSEVSMFKYGYNIMRDLLVREFEPLVAEMQAADFTDCATLDVTGFSLGGALATVFAVLSNAGKLELGTTVSGLYGFAPMPAFHGDMVTNSKSGDGCFAGGIYCNYVEEGGVPKVDSVCISSDYTFPKADFVKVGRASGITPCAQVTTSTAARAGPAEALMPAHATQLYINSLGCADAELDFDGSEFCAREAVAPFCAWWH